MQTSARHRHRGFTLVELMVVVVIAGIIAAVAYPTYKNQVQRSRRADAVALLTAVMQAQERYRSNISSYASSVSSDLKIDESKITPHYTISSLTGVSPPAGGAATLDIGYIATATPTAGGKQSGDVTCKSFTVQLLGAQPQYSSTGDPNNTGTDADTTSSCWPK